MRQYVAKNLEKYNESVPTQDSIEPEVVEEPENKKDKNNGNFSTNYFSFYNCWLLGL